MEKLNDERMTEEDLVTSLKSDVQDAVSFIDSDIAPNRAEATHFYHGRPFGDEEDGRSQIVMPVVRDTVRAMLPSLMKIFFGGSRAVEVVGLNAKSAEQSEEMTSAVEYVFRRQNPGFRIAWDAFKDALTRKAGFITWWWDDSVCVHGKVYDNVSEEQLDAAYATLEPNEELEVVSAQQIAPADEMQGIPAQFAYKIRITTREKKGKVRVAAIPPEEFIIDRHARSIEDAKVCGQRTLRTRGDLVAEGISRDILDTVSSHEGGQLSLSTNQEVLARQPSAMIGSSSMSETWDQVKVLYCCLYYRIDFDGDGISELRRIVTVGDEHKIISNEYADEVQIALLSPDPEPHVVFGLSVHDNVGDMQLIESHVTRDVLDSLKASIFPRTAYVEGQVNQDDVLNTEIGAAIRMRQPGMVQTLEVPFVGQQALPILEFLDAVKERRTGVRGSSPMLDAKALQSTNQVAVNAAVTGAQAQVELVARLFAETGMRRVFRGILKLLAENQRGPMMISQDGKPVPVDPRSWDVDVEVEVNAGLGTGQNDQKMATLSQVAEAQSGILQQLGPENPLVGFEHYYNTMKRMLELSGVRDVHNFWRDPKTYQAPPQEKQPTPEEIIAEAQMQIEAGKLSLEQLKTILEDDFKRDELDADIALRAAEINARYKAAVDTASLKALMDRSRLAHEGRYNDAKLKIDAAKNNAAEGSKPVVVNVQSPPRTKKVPVRDASGRVIEVKEVEEDGPGA